MERNKKFVCSIIIPTKNEEDCIYSTIKSLEENVKNNKEIIIVDSSSTDNTIKIVKSFSKQNSIKIITKEKLGFATAIIRGIKEAQSDIVIPVMADLCDEPKQIDVFIKKIQTEGYDIVGGSRYMSTSKVIGGPIIKKFLSKTVGLFCFHFIGLPIKDATNSFKAYRKKVFSSINLTSRDFEVSMEITVKSFLAGYKLTEIPTTWTDRKKGLSKFSISRVAGGYAKIFLYGLIKKRAREKSE